MKEKEILSETQIEQLESVGNKLRLLRISKGYTNYEYFAFENNIGRSQYGAYERGQNMNLATLIKILNLHGLTLEEFFKLDFDKTPKK